MFENWSPDSWSQWTWVIVSWLELSGAYLGYVLYLNWRERRAKDKS